MEEIDIPSYFLCPISLQLMKDPVTIPSGITYDREYIEKWVFSCNNATCPLTKHPIGTLDLTPNHTLRRLIQAWCTLNAVDRIPTPKPALDRPQILKLLQDAKNNTLNSKLRRLRSIAYRDDSSRLHLKAAASVVDFLSSVVTDNSDAAARDEAVDILHKIEPSDSDLRKLTALNDGVFLDSLMQIMDNGGYQSRAHAVTLMKSAFSVADPDHLIGTRPELFGLVSRIISDEVGAEASAGALPVGEEPGEGGGGRGGGGPDRAAPRDKGEENLRTGAGGAGSDLPMRGGAGGGGKACGRGGGGFQEDSEGFAGGERESGEDFGVNFEARSEL